MSRYICCECGEKFDEYRLVRDMWEIYEVCPYCHADASECEEIEEDDNL